MIWFSKPKGSTLSWCIEVSAEGKIEYEKMKMKGKKSLIAFFSVRVFRALKSIGSVNIDRTEVVHTPIERAQKIL